MIANTEHNTFMARCIELAKTSIGKTAPNPMVGSVIVYNQKIIGEGYHIKSGMPHAEVNAISSVKEKDLLQYSTLYVNLEPCSHYGKTPPCADLIISHKIPRVVIANIDPNPKVQGQGIAKLQDSGIEVISGILASEGEELNKRFFTFQRKSRPFVLLKWAQTQDGFIDILRNPLKPEQPTWITNSFARTMVHKWRTEEDSILVGTNTAFMDNPKLNVREWDGKNPVRIVLDNSLRLPLNLNLFDGTIPTLVFTSRETERTSIKGLEYIQVPFDDYLPEHILSHLYRRNIQSVLIEGGAQLLQTFIDTDTWDEARVFTGEKSFCQGYPAPKLPVNFKTCEKYNGFSLRTYKST